MKKINWNLSLTAEQLENIAKGLEDGEISPGAFILDLPMNHGLSPALVERLKPLLGRFHTKVSI